MLKKEWDTAAAARTAAAHIVIAVKDANVTAWRNAVVTAAVDAYIAASTAADAVHVKWQEEFARVKG